MTTIRSPELGPYKRGDLALIPCTEPDPVLGWAELAEHHAHDLRSIHCDGVLVASIGYMPLSIHEADAFAVINRDACKGIGAQVAVIVHNQIKRWMSDTGICQANASCAANDRAAQVFLRAVGFRKSATTAKTAYFTFIWS